MKPIAFPQANRTFVAPEGVSPDDCGPLPVHDTGLALISCWQLSDEERAEVARTGTVWLWVFGRGTPPVAVDGVSPFGPMTLDQVLSELAQVDRPADSEERIREEMQRFVDGPKPAHETAIPCAGCIWLVAHAPEGCNDPGEWAEWDHLQAMKAAGSAAPPPEKADG